MMNSTNTGHTNLANTMVGTGIWVCQLFRYKNKFLTGNCHIKKKMNLYINNDRFFLFWCSPCTRGLLEVQVYRVRGTAYANMEGR